MSDTFQLLVDISCFRCTPIECLHTILLGPYKYMLRAVMDKLTSRQKDEVLVRISSFPFSGCKEKLQSNICRYIILFLLALVSPDMLALL